MAASQYAEKLITSDDILDGAKNLSRNRPIWTLDTIPEWVKADEYLTWAQRALTQGDAFGYDAAVCYAKRAVCRLIDSFLIHNHLGRWRGSSTPYPKKMELLAEIGITIPDIAHDLIINPRNDIEHNYRGATQGQARHAVQLAELVLQSLEAESRWAAIISLGLNYGPMIGSADNDGETWPWGYSDNPRGAMLIVDMLRADLRVMIVDHTDEEVRYASLVDFSKEQTVNLVRLLRDQRTSGSYFMSGCAPFIFEDFRRRLGISS